MIEIPEFNINPDEWIDSNRLSGKNLSQKIREKIADRVKESGIKPGLAVLLVGDDPASSIYVSGKEKAALKAGFKSIIKKVPASTSEDEVKNIINGWNNDSSIHGILVQLPLPEHINEREILQTISYRKDADGFHFENLGRLLAKERGVVSCTPLGIIVMLKEAGFNLKGRHAVVLGRSNIVGKPVAQLLMDALQCTVTICHSRSSNTAEMVRSADILVSAMGVRGIVNPDDIKDDCVLVDVGMHRIDDKVTGDIDMGSLKDRLKAYTPVPGGVGPMTITMLLYNTLLNAERLQQ